MQAYLSANISLQQRTHMQHRTQQLETAHSSREATSRPCAPPLPGRHAPAPQHAPGSPTPRQAAHAPWPAAQRAAALRPGSPTLPQATHVPCRQRSVQQRQGQGPPPPPRPQQHTQQPSALPSTAHNGEAGSWDGMGSSGAAVYCMPGVSQRQPLDLRPAQAAHTALSRHLQ